MSMGMVRAALFAVTAFAFVGAARSDFVPQPYGWLYEAERTSNASVRADASASGGALAYSTQPWQPLAAVAKLPSDLPERVEVWTCRKGGPVCLKAVAADGKQREIAWTWGGPRRLTWQKSTELKAADRAGGLLVIKNGDAAETCLDALALVTNAAAAAVAFAPPPAQASVAVDWQGRSTHVLTPRHWAVNDYEIMKTEKPEAAFNAAFTALAPSMIRIHNAGLSEVWTTAGARDWDYERIRTAFTGIHAYKDTPVMLNIPTWPKWLSAEQTLPEERAEELAQLCAKLAKFFAKDLGVGKLYVEVLNEREETYERAGKLPELWQLLNRITAEVRRQVPQAKVGGPALTWPKGNWVAGYLENCGRQTDFVTWHNYASGSRDDSNDQVLIDRVQSIRDMAAGVRTKMKELGLGDKETFLTEYNISWTWETRDPRMTNNLGAVFDAQVVLAMAEVGVTGAFVWHLKDGIYGLMGGDNHLRPAYHLFRRAGKIMTGEVVPTTVSNADALKAVAVRRKNGGRALMLINRGENPLKIALTSGNAKEREINRITIHAEGESRDTVAADGPIVLQPYTIAILWR